MGLEKGCITNEDDGDIKEEKDGRGVQEEEDKEIDHPKAKKAQTQ